MAQDIVPGSFCLRTHLLLCHPCSPLVVIVPEYCRPEESLGPPLRSAKAGTAKAAALGRRKPRSSSVATVGTDRRREPRQPHAPRAATSIPASAEAGKPTSSGQMIVTGRARGAAPTRSAAAGTAKAAGLGRHGYGSSSAALSDRKCPEVILPQEPPHSLPPHQSVEGHLAGASTAGRIIGVEFPIPAAGTGAAEAAAPAPQDRQSSSPDASKSNHQLRFTTDGIRSGAGASSTNSNGEGCRGGRDGGLGRSRTQFPSRSVEGGVSAQSSQNIAANIGVGLVTAEDVRVVDDGLEEEVERLEGEVNMLRRELEDSRMEEENQRRAQQMATAEAASQTLLGGLTTQDIGICTDDQDSDTAPQINDTYEFDQSSCEITSERLARACRRPTRSGSCYLNKEELAALIKEQNNVANEDGHLCKEELEQKARSAEKARKEILNLRAQMIKAMARSRWDQSNDGVLGIQPTGFVANSLRIPASDLPLVSVMNDDHEYDDEGESKERDSEVDGHGALYNRHKNRVHILVKNKCFDPSYVDYVRKPDVVKIALEQAQRSKYTLRQVLMSRRFHLFKYRFANAL
mmetsp:Transcript_9876/g.18773  ORF Transcript_9876/g.18773 Transcript_9876/m.18773 type:complete len:575 (-) Transcript_9876:1233-2957(-)